MNTRVVTAILLVTYLIIAWFIGPVLQLQGRDLWVLRIALFLIGIAAAAAVLWFLSRQQGPSAQPADGTHINDFEGLLRAADGKLRTSRLGRKATLANLPVLILIGDRASSKTTIVVQSGMDPELLAGQVYRDGAVIPTESANFWFARGVILIETAGKLLSQAQGWIPLVRRLKPSKVASLWSGNQAARAAIVCVSCEDFIQSGASAATEGLARELRTQLDGMSSRLGIRLPVYVLFTKTDRVPFFNDYVRNLSAAEATQVLGATLGFEQEHGAAVYAERATERIGAAFRNIVVALADKRPEFLSREHDPSKLAGVYEFPREMGKLRAPMVKFLVDLCRPSQLRTTPFLRGFYFTGVRPVVLEESEEPAASLRQQAKAFDADAGATRIFRADERATPQPEAFRPSGRKVPQWTFVSHFFNDIALKDKAAMGASGSSVKTTALRRIALMSAFALLLVFAAGITVSYVGNRRLETEVITASRGIFQQGTDGGSVSLENLQRLEVLRQSLEKISLYQREGAPWRLRWGLYSGSAVYPEARRVYFTRFQEMLLQPAQSRLLETLRALPAIPQAGDDYGRVYDTLKAYLMTTSNGDRTLSPFLSPLLTGRWSEGREASPEQIRLAQQQFGFYADELPRSNPYSISADAAVVDRSRRYLSQFAGTERVYQAMIAEASQKTSAVSFSKRFQTAGDVVSNNIEVAGAFTKEGFAFMSGALRNADRFFSGEQWVLGESATAKIDQSGLEAALRKLYFSEFIKQWREFLSASTISRYTGIADGAKKLNRLSGNQSPLLSLLWLVSDNTSVASEEIKGAFQPVQFVVPPGPPDRLIGEANSPYMNSLLALQGLLEQIANTPGSRPDNPLLAEAAAKSNEAKLLTRQISQNFKADPVGRVDAAVQKLLEDPITNAEALVRNVLPGEVNAQGRAFCRQVQDVMSKYPFTSSASREASLQEMSSIYHPEQGALSTFFTATLSKYLTRQGSSFVVNPAGGVRINPAFLNYWTRVSAFSEALYPAKATAPRVPLELRIQRAQSVQNVTLSIEGQSRTSSGSSPSPMQFVWSASGRPVTLSARIGGSEFFFGRYDGPWALFRFFGDSENWANSGGTITFERILRQGQQGTPVTLRDGSRPILKFELQPGPVPMFQKDFFAGLRCVSDIALP